MFLRLPAYLQLALLLLYEVQELQFRDAVAALGGTVLVDTVDGRIAYDVKPGTPTDTRVRLRGKGVPSLRDKNVRGDHYISLTVQVPDKLSKEAKDLLKQFDELTGDSLHAAAQAGDTGGNPDGTEPGGKGSGGKKKKKGFFG